MKHKLILSLYLILVTAALTLLAVPVMADSGQPQVVYQTPTPSGDGRILYKVKEGDTCISISLLNKVPLDELRRLNGLQGENCPLRIGQEILLGVVAATQGPAKTATPTPPLPGSTPFNGKGEICIYLFDDINGNSMAEDTEPAIAGGAASITDTLGKISKTGQTVDVGGPLCFKDLPEGDYNISLAVPDGYNTTTAVQSAINLRAGERAILDFGAQMSSVAKPVPVSEGGHSPMLGIVGGILVLSGGGLWVYFRTMRR
jgi:hypothetical protein